MAAGQTSSNIQIKNAAIETIRLNDPLKHQIQIGTSQTNSYFTGRTDSIVFGTKPQNGKLYGMEMTNFNSNTSNASLQYLYSPQTNVVKTYPFLQVSSLNTNNAEVILQSDYGNFSTLRSENAVISTIRVSTIYANQVIANDLYMDGIISGKTVQAVSFETNGTIAAAENAVYIDALLYWMQTYLMPHKPSTIQVTASTIKGAELNVQWNNPETISFGVNSWMPVMSKFKFRLTDSSTPVPKTSTLTRIAANEVPAGVGSLDALTSLALRKYGTTSSVMRTIDGSNVNTLLLNLSNAFPQGFVEPLKAEIWLENNTGAGNSTTLSNLTFPAPSPPSAPGLTLGGATSSIFTVTPIAPDTNDTSLQPGDVAMPDLDFYTIKFKATGNAVRYGGLSASQTTTTSNIKPATSDPITLSNLHPDTTYEVQIAATNVITTTPSANNTATITTNGTTFRPSYLDSVDKIDFTSVYTHSTMLRKITDPNTTLDYAVLNATATTTANALYSAMFGPIGVHCFLNRGSTDTNIGQLYFDNGANQAVFNMNGFPGTAQSPVSLDNTIIKSITISDAGTSVIDQGYFLKQTFQIGLMKYAASDSVHTLMLKQTLADNTTYSKEIKFYTDDVDPTTAPSISSRSGQLSGVPSNLCGLKVYGTDVEYSVSNVVCTNMSQYFTLGTNTLIAKLNLGDKTLSVLDKASGIYDSQSKTFTMLSNTAQPVTFTFASTDYYQKTSGQVNLQVKNTTSNSSANTSAWSLISPSFPILVDPASIATAATYDRYAVPANFTASLSAFNDSAALADGELMLYQGKYVSKGTGGAFINYGSIAAGGGAADYSSSPAPITRFGTASNYRYAVFRFTIASGQGTTSIPTLSISLEGTGFSLLTSQKDGSSIRLVGDTANRNIELWYKVSQNSHPAVSTRWIDATSDINIGSFQRLAQDTSYTSILGGATRNPGNAATLGGTGMFFFVQTPSLQRDTTPITMYVMVGISDSSAIGISKVSVGVA